MKERGGLLRKAPTPQNLFRKEIVHVRASGHFIFAKQIFHREAISFARKGKFHCAPALRQARHPQTFLGKDAFLNSFAWLMPFCPVAASNTSKVSTSASGSSRPITRFILASSSIKFFLLCKRPAVSTIKTSAPRLLEAQMASYTTDAGSEPASCFTI